MLESMSMMVDNYFKQVVAGQFHEAEELVKRDGHLFLKEKACAAAPDVYSPEPVVVPLYGADKQQKTPLWTNNGRFCVFVGEVAFLEKLRRSDMGLDARVRYTKRVIRESFISLIKEKPFHSISRYPPIYGKMKIISATSSTAAQTKIGARSFAISLRNS